MEVICQKVPFLKHGILMIKAWMTYEASLLGSHAANMATYALYVLVVFLVNNFYIESPMELFRLFFNYFGKFDWDSQIITIQGTISILNFSDRLRNEFNFDLQKFALAERPNNYLAAKMRKEPLFSNKELVEINVSLNSVRLNLQSQ